MWKSCQEEDVPPPSCELTVLASLSRLPLPDLVVTEFVEMRLVEVNGAGWCLQLVSNRRGPGHLILCLLVARRRTNRSCRDGARAENKTQRSHAKQEAANTGCGLAGGDQLGRMLRAPLGPPMYLGSPWRPAAAAAHGSAPPPPAPRLPRPAPRPGPGPLGAEERASAAADSAPPPPARLQREARLPGAPLLAAGAGGATGTVGPGPRPTVPRRAPPAGPGTALRNWAALIVLRTKIPAKGMCPAFRHHIKGW